MTDQPTKAPNPAVIPSNIYRTGVAVPGPEMFLFHTASTIRSHPENDAEQPGSDGSRVGAKEVLRSDHI
jgi:hypothetical protein